MNHLKTIFMWVACGLLIGVTSTSCSKRLLSNTSIKYIDKIEYRDTTIYIPLIQEKYINITPKFNESFLESQYAFTRAWVDSTTNFLHHTLENKKDSIVYVTKWKERLIIKDSVSTVIVPKIEIKTVTTYPSMFWWLLGWAIVSVGFGIYRVLRKFRII